MATTPAFDHIALATPDLDGLVARLTEDFGMLVETRTPHFAIVVDPGSGLKLELSRSPDAAVRFRHFGFRTDDVDAAHETLTASGMSATHGPHRRDFARMYTSFLQQPDGLEVQLVKYD